MNNEPSVLEQILGFVDSVRGLIGFVVILFFAIAFVATGNAAGRLAGLLLLGGCLAIAISVARRRSRNR